MHSPRGGISMALGEVLLITAVRNHEPAAPLQPQAVSAERLPMKPETTNLNFTVRPSHP